MTITTSGPISLNDIKNEFGGSATPNLSDYYAGGAYVQNPAPTSAYQTAAIPTSGPISLGAFYGITKAFIYSDTISASTSAGYNASTRATALGWNGTVPVIATITVNSGVIVTAPNTATYAMLISGFPATSTISVTNNGYIVGRGGQGGAGGATTSSGSPGAQGGPALGLGNAIRLHDAGLIAGGGGGGGGGSSGGPGGTKGGGGGGGGWPLGAGGAGGAGSSSNGLNGNAASGTLPNTGATGSYGDAGTAVTGAKTAGGQGGPAGSGGVAGHADSPDAYAGGGAAGAPGVAIVNPGNVTYF